MTTSNHTVIAQAQHRHTIYQIAHIQRLAQGLQQILEIDFRRPLPLRICCAAVIAGSAISQHRTSAGLVYMGRPWSTAGALKHLAGCGYVFDPREALQALNRLVDRHIIDRRRLDERDCDSGGFHRRGNSVRGRQHPSGDSRRVPARDGTHGFIIGDGRYALEYVSCRP